MPFLFFFNTTVHTTKKYLSVDELKLNIVVGDNLDHYFSYLMRKYSQLVEEDFDIDRLSMVNNDRIIEVQR